MTLNKAVRSGDYDAVRALLDEGADVNEPEQFDWTPLMYAVQRGDAEMARLLLDRGAQSGHVGSDGKTALTLACGPRRNPPCEALMRDACQKPIALVRAAERGDFERVQELLWEGVDIDARGEEGRTALMAAILGGRELLAQFLLEQGAAPEAIACGTDELYCTAMSLAAALGHLTTIRLMIERGVSTDAVKTPRVGFSKVACPLEAASGAGQNAVLDLFYEHRDKIKDFYRQSYPMGSAIECGHLETVRWWLDRLDHIHTRKLDSWILSIAASCDKIEIFRLVFAHEAQDRSPNVMYETLQVCLPPRRVEMAWMLIEEGALSAAKADKEDLMHHASGAGSGEIVSYLLDRGVNIEARDGDGTTPLMMAAYRGQESTVRLLLERGADPDGASNSQWTPLMAAAAMGRVKAAQALIEGGADVRARDCRGDLAWTQAVEGGHTEVIELLERAGGRG